MNNIRRNDQLPPHLRLNDEQVAAARAAGQTSLGADGRVSPEEMAQFAASEAAAGRFEHASAAQGAAAKMLGIRAAHQRPADDRFPPLRLSGDELDIVKTLVKREKAAGATSGTITPAEVRAYADELRAGGDDEGARRADVLAKRLDRHKAQSAHAMVSLHVGLRP